MPKLSINKTLESQWKSVYKSRLKKTGMSELMRTADKRLNTPKCYFHKTAATAITKKALAETMRDNFARCIRDIQQLNDSFKEWTDAEAAFLKELIQDMQTEEQFWKGRVKVLN